MKKMTTILLALMLCIMVFAGCGITAPDSSPSSDTAETKEPAAPTATPNLESNPNAGEEGDTSEESGVPYSQEDIIGLWHCTLKEEDYSPKIIGYLRFGEDGSLAFDYGDGYGPAGMGMVKYRGGWHIDADRGASNLPAPLVLDLSIDNAVFAYDEENFPGEINGIYTFVIEDGCLFLSVVDGDNLYSDEGEPWLSYDFERDSTIEEGVDFWKMSDSELIEYVEGFLYENYHLVDTDVFYPLELDKWEENTLWYGFVYADGDRYRYAWLNATTGEVTVTDEVENYTREG